MTRVDLLYVYIQGYQLEAEPLMRQMFLAQTALAVVTKGQKNLLV